MSFCECGCGREASKRFVKGHNRRKSSVPFVVDSRGCWNWQRATTPFGYGQKWTEGRNVLAHRFFYEALVGAIPAGLELDHLCRNPRCVNPRHVEPVTHRENVLRGNGWAGRHARQTHCVNGHPYNETNTYITAAGHRDCRACHRERARRRAAA